MDSALTELRAVLEAEGYVLVGRHGPYAVYRCGLTEPEVRIDEEGAGDRRAGGSVRKAGSSRAFWRGRVPARRIGGSRRRKQEGAGDRRRAGGSVRKAGSSRAFWRGRVPARRIGGSRRRKQEDGGMMFGWLHAPMSHRKMLKAKEHMATVLHGPVVSLIEAILTVIMEDRLANEVPERCRAMWDGPGSAADR